MPSRKVREAVHREPPTKEVHRAAIRGVIQLQTAAQHAHLAAIILHLRGATLQEAVIQLLHGVALQAAVTQEAHQAVLVVHQEEESQLEEDKIININPYRNIDLKETI